MTRRAHNGLMLQPSAHAAPVTHTGVAVVVHRGSSGEPLASTALLSRTPLYRGGDLGARLAAVQAGRAQLSWGEALAVVVGLAGVLDDMRARRIVHGWVRSLNRAAWGARWVWTDVQRDSLGAALITNSAQAPGNGMHPYSCTQHWFAAGVALGLLPLRP